MRIAPEIGKEKASGLLKDYSLLVRASKSELFATVKAREIRETISRLRTLGAIRCTPTKTGVSIDITSFGHKLLGEVLE